MKAKYTGPCMRLDHKLDKNYKDCCRGNPICIWYPLNVNEEQMFAIMYAMQAVRAVTGYCSQKPSDWLTGPRPMSAKAFCDTFFWAKNGVWTFTQVSKNRNFKTKSTSGQLGRKTLEAVAFWLAYDCRMNDGFLSATEPGLPGYESFFYYVNYYVKCDHMARHDGNLQIMWSKVVSLAQQSNPKRPGEALIRPERFKILDAELVKQKPPKEPAVPREMDPRDRAAWDRFKTHGSAKLQNLKWVNGEWRVQ